ncbi:MAG: lipid ABC transporter permease/ATP-binding protein, partial [Francisella sp.]
MLYSSVSTSNPVTNFALYRRLWRYLAPYWKGFFVAVVAMVIASLTTPLFALLTKPLVDKGFVEHNHYYTTYIPLAIIGLFLLRGVATYINDYLVTYLSSDLVHQIRLEMYQKIMQLPVSFFKNIPSGRLVSKVINDANQITDAGFNVITVLAKDGVMVVGLITVLFYLDWQLTLITIATLLAVSLLIHLVSSRLRHLTLLNQGYMGNMTQLLQESINGVKEIKIYQSYRLNLRLFSMISHAVKYNLVKQRSANSLSSGITQWLIAIALAAIIYFAGLRAQEGFTPGAFMSFITSMIAMFDPMKRMTDVMQSLQRGMAGTQSVFAFLDEVIENDQGQAVLNGLREGVVFDQV